MKKRRPVQTELALKPEPEQQMLDLFGSSTAEEIGTAAGAHDEASSPLADFIPEAVFEPVPERTVEPVIKPVIKPVIEPGIEAVTERASQHTAPQLPPEQHDGLHQLDLLHCSLSGKTLIEASAGTGKTWNICGLYLRLLLERKLKVDQILVVTFTNAATAELRERIRSRLVDALNYLRHQRGSDEFIVTLMERLSADPDNSAQQMRLRLDLALQSFDEAAIFTIHAFCQRALADTPFAAGTAFAVEMAQDDHLYQAEAVNDFWRRYLASEAATPELANYLVECKDSPEKFIKLLKRHASKPKSTVIWPAAMAAPMPDIADLRALYHSAAQMWRDARGEIQAVLTRAMERGDLSATSYKPHLIELACAELDLYFSSGMAGLCSAKMRLLSSVRLETGTRRNKVTPRHAFFDAVAEIDQQSQACLIVARLRMMRELIETGPAAVREAKRNRRTCSFDDLLFNLYQSLNASDGERLAESLRARYPVALIDEFQDTDPLQFDIFKKIYIDNDDGALFLVGDPKQAIYSFRNADLHTYLQAKQHTSIACTLASNQRSSAGLISALNQLFSHNQHAFMLDGLDYHQVLYGQRRRAEFVDQSAARGGDLRVWALPTDPVWDRNTAIDFATEATANEIARLLEEARAGRITLDQRPLEPGDIAVLVRSHREAARVRAALSARNVACIEISQDSVFDSHDAADLEAVLCAIMEPARTGLLLAALATSMMGYQASEIEAIAADEKRLMDRIGQFSRYRELWFRRGLGFMYRNLLNAEQVAQRMLCRPDGDRCMTNLRHLGDYLQQASEQFPAPEATLRWLQTQRRNSSADEAAQLRLESDQNLVQILTIHKSKGLEYPVVFCPFLWDSLQWSAPDKPQGREYHDHDGKLLIDFRNDDEAPDAKQVMRDEECAERLRLIYVALTRAAHRCYLVGGVYSKQTRGDPSMRESACGMLNWLIAGAGFDTEQWHDKKRRIAASDIDSAWRDWAAAATPHVLLSPITDTMTTRAALPPASALALRARISSGAVQEDWRTGSFTQMLRNSGERSNGGDRNATPSASDTIDSAGVSSQRAERAPADHDWYAQASNSLPQTIPTALPADDILRFPRGPNAGTCLHAVFEHADFTDRSQWPQAVQRALREFPQPLGNSSVQQQAAMLHNMLADVLATPLTSPSIRESHSASAFTLSQIRASRRLTEMEFRFPSEGLRAKDVNSVLAQHGYEVPVLTFSTLQGFLKGFIDLVFEHDGRYYLLDWKSNHLGYQPEDYTHEGIAPSMSEHGYHLQYLLYTVALHRYLRSRVRGYAYEQHIGGAFYLFVRGVRPDWQLDGQQTGVYFNRPTLACIEAIEALLGFAEAQEVA